MNEVADSIAAIATPPGRGGVGIIRISGPKALNISYQITKLKAQPRQVHYTSFYRSDDSILDEGLCIFFRAPHSFTGEDIVELQAHGGPIILDLILAEVIGLGARMAEPGEFSLRAFLNNKLDLAQAEAIADLINAESKEAALSATRSLQGEFSTKINSLVEKLIYLRMFVEAAIDFPEEEIDFLQDDRIATNLQIIEQQFIDILNSAKQGTLLRDGFNIVLAGKPNAGKSSLLNALSQQETAIVTDIPGTTRDVIRESIQIDGLPIHILDTAGLRDTHERVEQEGIKRAKAAIAQADCVIIVIDISDPASLIELLADLPADKPKIIVFNKIDKSNISPKIEQYQNTDIQIVYLSAKHKQGLDLLQAQIKGKAGYQAPSGSSFIARRRHLDAIVSAKSSLMSAKSRLLEKSGELVAEELKIAQNHLSSITGEFSADDLLGEIFSSFCIGK